MELFEYGSIRAASLVQDETLDLASGQYAFLRHRQDELFPPQTEHLVFCVSRRHHLAKIKKIP